MVVWRRVPKAKHIQPNDLEPGKRIEKNSSPAFHYQHISTPSRRTIRTVLLAEALPLVMIITIPLSVHAGLFTSMIKFLEAEEVATADIETVSRVSDVRLLSSRTNVDPKAALGGGDLIIDNGTLIPSAPFGADDFADEKVSNGEISVYTVREGDSLSQIAEMFGVTTNTILWANDLPKATAIRPGDELVILPIVGVRHIVKEGDTLSSIAKKYESDTEEILSYNQLGSASDLEVGLALIIPGGNMHTAAPKKAAPAKSSGGGTAVASTGNAAGFTHPLPGARRTQGIHGYNGVDLAAAVGTPIKAAAGGEVIVSRSSGWNGGYGNYVVIKHANGAQTLYAHMSSNAVGVGATVGAGETIGYVGNTGRSTGAHLHFEVRGATNPF